MYVTIVCMCVLSLLATVATIVTTLCMCMCMCVCAAAITNATFCVGMCCYLHHFLVASVMLLPPCPWSRVAHHYPVFVCLLLSLLSLPQSPPHPPRRHCSHLVWSLSRKTRSGSDDRDNDSTYGGGGDDKHRYTHRGSSDKRGSTITTSSQTRCERL